MICKGLYVKHRFVENVCGKVVGLDDVIGLDDDAFRTKWIVKWEDLPELIHHHPCDIIPLSPLEQLAKQAE